MRAEYREGERFERLTFTGETFYDCDFSDCVFADCTFEDCKLDHSVLTECQFLRCTVTNLKTTMSRAKFTDFESCTLNNIDWMSLQGDGAFADPIESLRDCRLKYNTFTEMNLTKFKFAGSVIQRSMFASAISSARILRNATCWTPNFSSAICARQTSKRPAGIKSTFSAASCRTQNSPCRRQCRCWEI